MSSDFMSKMHQIQFPLGLRPRPRCGSLQRSPDPLAGFKGPTSKGRGGEGTGGGERRVGQGRAKAGRERVGGKGQGKGEGEEGEWGSPTHYFRLKRCTALALGRC